MEASKLSFYSVATVAANKALSSHDIEVIPLEDLPMTNGELSDNTESYVAAAKDTEGAAYEVDVPTTVTVKATWLPIGSSNRKTAPDVRRGETVVLYRFADTDKYYWSTLKDDSRLRKLETVIFAFSATRDESKDTTSETSYFLEISTHKKLIHLHTCRADGEPFAYDIQLNTAEGFFTIQDDDGNSIQLDSAQRRLQMFNKDGSVLDINKTQIFMSSKDLIDMKSQAIVMNSQTYDQTASTNTITATTQTITAQTLHKGNISIQGNMSQSGVGGAPGTAAFTGGMTVTQDVVANGVSLVSHGHPETNSITGAPIPG